MASQGKNEMFRQAVHQAVRNQFAQPKTRGRMDIYLKGMGFPVQVIKDIFVNTDGGEGHLYLVCSDLTETYQ